MVQHGDAKLLGYVGDEASYQLGAIFISTKTADNRGDMVKRFLTAYRHGAKDYHDAVTGPGEKRQDGPGTDAMLKILAKYIGQTPEHLSPVSPMSMPRRGSINMTCSTRSTGTNRRAR